MRFWVTFTSGVLLAAVLCSVLPVSGEAAIYDDVLRFHVIAESDSEADQTLKLHVRDAVIAAVADRMAAAGTVEEATRTAEAMRDEIRQTAEECARSWGSDCAVTVTVGRETYPRRVYESFTLPAGEYESVRVVLGEGKGHNWWCVLFPSVCLYYAGADREETLAVGFTPEEYRLITGNGEDGVTVKFRVLELISEWARLLRGGRAA